MNDNTSLAYSSESTLVATGSLRVQHGLKIDKENLQQEMEQPKRKSLSFSSPGLHRDTSENSRLQNNKTSTPVNSKVLRNHFARLKVDGACGPELAGKERMIASGALRIRSPTAQFAPEIISNRTNTNRLSPAVRVLNLQPGTASQPSSAQRQSKTSPHRKGRKVKCRRRRHRSTPQTPNDNAHNASDPLYSREILVDPASSSVNESILTDSSLLMQASASLFRPVPLDHLDSSVAGTHSSDQSSVYSLSAEIKLESPCSSMPKTTTSSTPSHRRRHCVDPVAFTLWKHTTDEVRDGPPHDVTSCASSRSSGSSGAPRQVSDNWRDVYGGVHTNLQIFRPIPVPGRRIR